MAPWFSILAWKIPWAEEPGGLQCMGPQGAEHDWAELRHLTTKLCWFSYFSSICLEIKGVKVLKSSIHLAKLASREFFKFFTPGIRICMDSASSENDKTFHLVVSGLFLCDNIVFVWLYSVLGTSIEAELTVGWLDIVVFILQISRYCNKLLVTYLLFSKNINNNMTSLFLYYDLENKGATNMGTFWSWALYTEVSNEFKIICCSVIQYVRLFVTPWTVACQASLSFTVSQSLLKLMSNELMMPSNHLIPCLSLLLLPSVFPNIMVFSSESALYTR